ncbi:MAG: ATP-dependent DNA helicase RecG [Candidatus Polarisedimenticolaceae bacterium]|nr:ATP-dependent DNA helicase RecG [Candidatus Polarisedimenticolaceae bacterium]
MSKIEINRPLAEIPVTTLKGVGPKGAERLAKLGIESLQDLLFHLPLRYQDRTRITPIGALNQGDQVVIEGVVELSDVRFGRRRSLLVQVADGTGTILLRFFHFSSAQRAALSRGVRLRCFGEIRNGPSSFEMIHPEYQRIDDAASQELEAELTPIYPTTEGMHQLTWRTLTQQVLDLLASNPYALADLLPLEQQSRRPTLAEALHYLHRPPPDAPLAQLFAGEHPAQQRLIFEELTAHQISLRQLRQQQQQIPAPIIKGDALLQQRLLKSLPFQLTGAQQRVVDEILSDLQRPFPMLRLVQGDVGSGKTVVSALAALATVEAGYQVALMAPTELLAEQHLNNFTTWLRPLGIEPLWLTGRHKGRERKERLQRIADGSAKVVVGTHALFQDDVIFHSLGLAVIDEQHRFGVHQRLALREKGHSDAVPHQLIMTATPIPRTLAMTAYADLDLSVIDELPPGRTPVTTVVISDSRRDEVISRVSRACADGRQAYWVCTLIEESEMLQCQAAEESAQQLTERLPNLRVSLVHGRLKATEKAAVMADFKAGKIDLLVATTVIEVGVDVANASLMIIENPERLGLAQLHQLRGRVGRGTTESHCLLMYHPPLSGNAKARLAMLRESNDGFKIAEKDLELRGPGEVLGTRQTGEMQLRIADVLRDQDLLPDVQQAADEILQRHPELVEPLIHRWLGERVEFGRV